MKASGLKAYVAVTAAYWAFMLSDGALRMLVLLHFHTLGFSPVQLAYLFLLYEFMGIVTNLSAGWLAIRFGLTSTLYAGLSLQIAALLALASLDPGWTITASVVFVMAWAVQMGCAADRIEECRQRIGFLHWRRFAWPVWFLGLCFVDGNRAVRHPCSGGDHDAARLAVREEGDEGQCDSAKGCRYPVTLSGAGVSVRSAGHMVCCRHSGVLLRGVVGWVRSWRARGFLHDRHLNGALDHLLRYRTGQRAPPAARQHDVKLL